MRRPSHEETDRPLTGRSRGGADDAPPLIAPLDSRLLELRKDPDDVVLRRKLKRFESDQIRHSPSIDDDRSSPIAGAPGSPLMPTLGRIRRFDSEDSVLQNIPKQSPREEIKRSMLMRKQSEELVSGGAASATGKRGAVPVSSSGLIRGASSGLSASYAAAGDMGVSSRAAGSANAVSNSLSLVPGKDEGPTSSESQWI